MKIIVEDLAKEKLNNIFSYNSLYSFNNAIETDFNISLHIQSLEDFPYSGRYIPEIAKENFRELIYKKSKHSIYRIMYYVSEKLNTAFVFNIMNSRQDFYRILKTHNYFNNYLNL